VDTVWLTENRGAGSLPGGHSHQRPGQETSVSVRRSPKGGEKNERGEGGDEMIRPAYLILKPVRTGGSFGLKKSGESPRMRGGKRKKKKA